LVQTLLDDELLTDAQRRDAMIFHGRWDEVGELSPRDQLRLRVLQHRVMPTPEERDDGIEALARAIEAPSAADLYQFATAAWLGGEPAEALSIPDDFDLDAEAIRWRLLRAEACEDLGRYPDAVEQLAPIRERVRDDLDKLTSAEDLTAAARAVLTLARLEGRPAADFHLANKLLAKARDEADPLYWPAYVAEAELLYAKGNPQQAMEAIGQALSLNPKSSEAWHLFGSMRCRFFDFDSANRAVRELHAINPKHPLADALAVEIALRQKDVESAIKALEPALERYPRHRGLLALNAAAQAMTYDEASKRAALDRFAELAPGNPVAEHAVGQALSDARQYALAEPHLKRAIEMMPGWSKPQLTLGELYVQWGKLDAAATQLRLAASLDPFHKQITNQLTLVTEMLGYDVIERAQFTVRYLPGVDEVLARDVALHMDKLVDRFIARFAHDPPALTQIDLMPDDQHFAVRITGMPDVWTIAACTGDVIAMTPPRPGPKRAYGTYNWHNVMGHEYAHVVNLSQTDNRVPHWFTEGCAVNMETTGRLWSQYQLLAECYNNDRLFDYDALNWGFIRPTESYHRPLAYAQSAWIKQYIEETFGWDKAIEMLTLYRRGVGEHEVIRRVFDADVASFMDGFSAWAGDRVAAWGMSTYGVEIEDADLLDVIATQDVERIGQERLDKLLAEHPGEPMLLKIIAQRAIKSGDAERAIAAIKRYQEARPVDPWSARELARLALQSGDTATAVAALKTLDTIEGDAAEYAVELARVYRGRKDYERALHYAERALFREPYNATLRESAATIAIQQGDLSRAAFHVESLAILEPERSIHPKRLSVLYQRLDRPEDAEAARREADRLELLD
ncbi:MAG: tetratricopeptide repeat protein, partial [Phycisphaeraceae bacterium]